MGPSQVMPKPWAFPGAYILLALILLAGGYLAGFWHAPDRVTQVQTKQVEAKVDSPEDIRKMGPGEEVPCEGYNIPAALEDGTKLACEVVPSPDGGFTVILVTAP